MSRSPQQGPGRPAAPSSRAPSWRASVAPPPPAQLAARAPYQALSTAPEQAIVQQITEFDNKILGSESA